MARRNLLTAFFSVEDVPDNFYGDPHLGPWPVAGLRAARYQVYPALQKVHKAAGPLTHKFAAGFKWRTETYSRHSFPSKACLATFMATLGFGTLACGWPTGSRVPGLPRHPKSP